MTSKLFEVVRVSNRTGLVWRSYFFSRSEARKYLSIWQRECKASYQSFIKEVTN